MRKFLKNNWFKLLVITAVFIFLFLYFRNQQVEKIKYCRDSAYKYTNGEEGYLNLFYACMDTLKNK